MAKYRKVENCGRVPHPDRSGKFLHDGEVAEGDDWEPLVALGFVVRVDEGAAPAPAPVKIEEPKAAILTEDPQGVSNVVQQPDVASGAEEVDSSETGQPGDEGVSGRASTRRRR